MKVMENASCFDQLQAVEPSCLEVAARKAQLVELRRRDKVRGANSSAHTVDDDSPPPTLAQGIREDCS